MIGAWFQAIGTAITQFAGVVGNGFDSIGNLIWTSEGGITFLGSCFAIVGGVGIVYFGFRMIRGLLNRGKGA